MWRRRRSLETFAGFWHWHFGGSIQWFDEDWTGANWLAKNIVQNATKNHAATVRSGSDACWPRHRYKPQRAMLCVNCRLRHELAMQTGGFLMTRKVRLLGNWNIFIVSHPPHGALQHRTPNHLPQWFTQYGCRISSICPISGGASSQIWIGHYHGMTSTTLLEFGTLFRNTTWALLDQKGLAWQPQRRRGIGRSKYSWDSMIFNFLPLEECSFMGDRRNWCWILAFKPA